MSIQLEPIGFAYIKYKGKIPRHWTVSDIEGTLVIHEQYREGLKDIQAGQRIVVLFHFHRSPAFTSELLTQKPPHRNEPRGVFSTCSPIRPNPIGLSVLEVLSMEGNLIHVKRIDLLDGTPILDIKPYVEDQYRNLEKPYTPDDSANLVTIVTTLRQIQAEGGAQNFVIFKADDEKNYYIQFTSGRGDMKLYAEAVSNKYLSPQFALNAEQIQALKKLGWAPPVEGFVNFNRTWDADNDAQRLAIARLVMRTFGEIYGIDPARPLTIELGIE